MKSERRRIIEQAIKAGRLRLSAGYSIGKDGTLQRPAGAVDTSKGLIVVGRGKRGRGKPCT